VAAVLGLALALLFATSAGAAPAQSPTTSCDPTYGCTTTTAPPPAVISCHGEITGQQGGPQSVRITDGPPNAAVQVVFNGGVIGSGQTDSQGNADVPFQLPIGVEGSYEVMVAGASFNASCDPAVHWDGGVSGIGNGRGTTGGGSKGVLAFTGFHLLLWVLVAAFLVLVGAALRRASRGRYGAARF
jgi:hypothetical protein